MTLSPIYSPAPVQWQDSPALIGYPQAVARMEARAAQIADGAAPELVWALQHPPLYTAGTSAQESDLISPGKFPVYQSGRGGQYTYHGPGQLVVYFMLDLKHRGRDVRAFVCALEDLIISALAEFGVTGERRAGRVGVWTVLPSGEEAKIAALGVRIRRWVSFHGISINVDPDLSHFSGIVPCGISEHGVTSLAALGIKADAEDVSRVLKEKFETRFGPLTG